MTSSSIRPGGWPAAAPTSAGDGDCLDHAIEKGALARALETPLPAALLEARRGAITTNTTEGGARGQE